jgi:hypothetical protein
MSYNCKISYLIWQYLNTSELILKTNDFNRPLSEPTMYICVPYHALSYALPDIAGRALCIVTMPKGTATVNHRGDDSGT